MVQMNHFKKIINSVLNLKKIKFRMNSRNILEKLGGMNVNSKFDLKN